MPRRSRPARRNAPAPPACRCCPAPQGPEAPLPCLPAACLPLPRGCYAGKTEHGGTRAPTSPRTSNGTHAHSRPKKAHALQPARPGQYAQPRNRPPCHFWTRAPAGGFSGCRFGRAPVPVGLRFRQQHAASSVPPAASLGCVGWCGVVLSLHAFECID